MIDYMNYYLQDSMIFTTGELSIKGRKKVQKLEIANEHLPVDILFSSSLPLCA